MSLSKTFENKTLPLVLLWSLTICASLVALYFYYPPGVDWEYTFSRAAQNWQNPYTLPSFTSPPWIVLLLWYGLLPLGWSNAINLCLNMVVMLAVIWRYQGGWQAAALTFTCPMMFDLARTNNIDWIPLLSFLVPPAFGLPLLALKPQVLGGAALIWFKKYGYKPFIPVVVITLVSFAIWGFWPSAANLPKTQLWNFAPWPFAIPLGIYILYRAWQASDEIMAAAATPFLTPYFAPYSLPSLMALIACKFRREAFYVWAGFWIYTIVEARRLPFLLS